MALLSLQVIPIDTGPAFLANTYIDHTFSKLLINTIAVDTGFNIIYPIWKLRPAFEIATGPVYAPPAQVGIAYWG